MKKNVILIILACLTVLCICGSGHGKEYVIAIADVDYLPYYQQENGVPKGLVPEIINRFAADSGLLMKLEFMSASRYYKLLFHDMVDFIIPDTPMWSTEGKMEHKVIYSETFMVSIDGVIVKAENRDITFDDLHKVGTMMGFTPFAIVDQVKAGKIKLIENRSQYGLFRQLQADFIDGIYLNIDVGMHYGKQTFGDGKFVFARNVPFSLDNYKISTIRHPEVITKFNHWVKENRDWLLERKRELEVEVNFESNIPMNF